MKKQMQKGFSLVELMVVIAIIAILAAVAIPMYSNYTTRAKIGSELAKAGGVKAEVAEALSNGQVPSGASIDLPTGVTVNAASTNTSGIIDVDTGAIISGTSISLTGTVASGAITWACTQASGSTALTSSQLPSNCTA